MSIEDLLDECGGFGKYQVAIVLAIFSHKLSVAWSMMQMSYAGFIPDWHCVTGSKNQTLYSNDSLKKCSLNSSLTGYEPQECTSYDFDPRSRTIISEFDLVCDRNWVKATVTSIQMVGVLLGAFMAGQTAEIFGRKKTLFGFSATHALINIGAAFSTSWEMFATFRFFLGIGVGALLVVTFPYPMEFLPTKARPLAGIIPSWVIGVCIFAVTAMWLEDWSYLHIACAIVNLPPLIGWFYLPESVRWLTLRGRFDEAEAIFYQMAAVNGKDPPMKIKPILEVVYRQEKESKTRQREYSYWDLFKGWQLSKVTIIFSYLWCMLSMSFYGISFGVSALSGNLYFNIFLLSVIETPAIFTTYYFNNKIGRKLTCQAFLLVATVSAIGCLVVIYTLSPDSQGSWITGFSLAAKLGVGASWAVTQIWVTELFPTCVRSLGYGIVNGAARVGGIMAPFVIDLDNHQGVAYTVIAVMFTLAHILIFILPETKGQTLSDSFGVQPSSVTVDKQKDTKLSAEPQFDNGDTNKVKDDKGNVFHMGSVNGAFVLDNKVQQNSMEASGKNILVHKF